MEKGERVKEKGEEQFISLE